MWSYSFFPTDRKATTMAVWLCRMYCLVKMMRLNSIPLEERVSCSLYVTNLPTTLLGFIGGQLQG